MFDRLITLQSFHDLILAKVCGSFLEENGIRCALVKTDLLPGLISPELAPFGHINLDVCESDLVPALAMLQHAGLIPRFDADVETNSSKPMRSTEFTFLCEFCSAEITIAVSEKSSIANCPNCLEYVDVPESS